MRPGGRGRLRPGRTLSLFRCRRARAAAARQRCAAGHGPAHPDRGVHQHLLGCGAGDRLQRADPGRMPGRSARRCHRPDVAAGEPAGHGPPRCLPAAGGGPRRGHGPQGLFRGQVARNAPPPPQVREHALRPGTQLQGIARWLARPADRAVGGQGRRPRAKLGRAGLQRPGYPPGSAPDQGQRGPAEPDPGAPAPAGAATGRPPGVRPADGRGRVVRFPGPGARKGTRRAAPASPHRGPWSRAATSVPAARGAPARRS